MTDSQALNCAPTTIAGPFTLGTAQFGLDYGLGAARDGLDAACVSAILDRAAEGGVVWLDTARAYGDAEGRIGAWSRAHSYQFKLVSKLPNLAGVPDGEVETAAQAAFDESEARLGRTHIDIYLTHKATDLQRLPVIGWLQSLQAGGRIGAFGASAYTAEEAAAALSVPGLGALQIPLNVTSAAFIESGFLKRVKARGIVLFARSVFLQGALLLSPERLPAHLRPLSDVNMRLGRLAQEAGVTLPELLVATIRQLPGVSSLVLGVDSPSQLTELIATADGPEVSPDARAAALQLGRRVSREIADPRTWPKT